MASKNFADDGAYGAGNSTGSDSQGYSGGYGNDSGGQVGGALAGDWNMNGTGNAGSDALATEMASGYDGGFHFEDGGPVDDGGGDSSGSDVGSLLALALSSVDAGLDFGRKKYGLSGGEQQQASMFGRTPAVPGNQSESGIPRPQPMPGPLPPTSNPFGQRKQFGQNDQDQDDQGTQTAQAGAIPDNDEDDQEGTA